MRRGDHALHVLFELGRILVARLRFADQRLEHNRVKPGIDTRLLRRRRKPAQIRISTRRPGARRPKIKANCSRRVGQDRSRRNRAAHPPKARRGKARQACSQRPRDRPKQSLRLPNSASCIRRSFRSGPPRQRHTSPNASSAPSAFRRCGPICERRTSATSQKRKWCLLQTDRLLTELRGTKPGWVDRSV